jgi:hypothetical protein
MRKRKEEDISIASLANGAIKEIQLLAKDNKLSHKLAAFNLILFLIVLGLNISVWFFGFAKDNMALIIQIVISMIFSAIITVIYSKFVKLLLDIITQKVKGFRASISVLMAALTFSLIGLLFQKEIFLNISGILLLLQTVIILIFGFLNLSKVEIEDKPIAQINIRQWLGDISNIITIGSFIADIIIILVSFLK